MRKTVRLTGEHTGNYAASWSYRENRAGTALSTDSGHVRSYLILTG